MRQGKKVSAVVFSLIFLAVVVLYQDTLGRFFFQDDWFLLAISRAKDAGDILGFFHPRSDVIFYRPLAMQVYFYGLQSLFGLSALPFHISVFFIHFVNIVLVWRVAQTVFKQKLPAYLACFYYAVAGFHFIPFYWPSTFSFVLGPMWYFLTVLFYIGFDQTKKPSQLICSYLFFFLGLFTSELLITLPFILSAYKLVFKRMRKQTRNLLGYFIALVPYYLLRFRVGNVPLSESYQPGASAIFATGRAYILWLLQWPEEISKQFIGPLHLNPQFLRDFRLLSFFLIALLILVVFTSLWCIGYLIKDSLRRKKPAQDNIEVLIYGVVWFLLAISPLLFFPRHIFPYYLSIPSVGFFLALAGLEWYGITRISSRVPVQIAMVLTAALIWFGGAYVTNNFNQLTHWAAKRSRITQVIFREMRRKYRYFPPDTVIVMPKDELLKVTLNDQRAVQLVFAEESLKTVYSEGKDEEREKFIPANDQELLERYPITVVFPSLQQKGRSPIYD